MMVDLYRRFFGKSGESYSSAPKSLESLKETHDYPVLNAEQLIRLVGVGGKINSIRQNAALEPGKFNLLYKTPIDRFIEAAQLQPASASDHHARLGGLIEHTLDVTERAMAHRRHLQLPTNSPPELIARQRDLWTYVIFVGALLHDAGKLLTLSRLHPDKGKGYSPLGPSILSTPADTYQIEFLKPNYEYQVRISIAALSFIPPEGQALIANNQQAFRELTAWLSSLPYEWGTVGKVCREADMDSVSEDMTPGGDRSRLHNAGRPVAERLMTAIRAELATESVPINRDGALGWMQGDTLWLVCKPTIERARRRLREMAAKDIPGEDKDEILFDSLMSHGYCVPTIHGQSIWYVRVTTDEYDHPLTMLRFEASRAIPPTRKIKSFEGTITVIDQEQLRQLRAGRKTGASPVALAQEGGNVNGDRVTPEYSEPEPIPDYVVNALYEAAQSESFSPASPLAPATDNSPSSPPPPVAPVPSPASHEPEPADTTTQSAKPATSAAPTTPPAAPKKKIQPEENLTGSKLAANTINKLVAQDHASIKTEKVELDDPLIGRYFLTWVRQSYDSSLLTANIGNDSKLHVLPEGIALVNPALFNQFLKLHGMAESGDKEVQKVRDRIRKAMKKEGLLIKTESGYDIHHVLLPKGRFAVVRLFAILVPTWALFDPENCPAINESVTLRKGKYKPDSLPPPQSAL